MKSFRTLKILFLTLFLGLIACQEPSPTVIAMDFMPGVPGSIHQPLYSPYGAKIELEAIEKVALSGMDHLTGTFRLGQDTNALSGISFVVARSNAAIPYDLLWLDNDGGDNFTEKNLIKTEPKESRGKWWSSFDAIPAKAKYIMDGKVQEQAFPISMWMVVEQTDEQPGLIRFSRKGFKLASFVQDEIEQVVVLSDANNDGLFQEEDWWYIRPEKSQEKLRDSRKIGDFAWANGKAWKLNLSDIMGNKGVLEPFDPGITEEEDLESRDLYKADKEAERAKEALAFSKDYELTKKEAMDGGQAYFIKFEAEWCGPCKLMDKYVYNAKDVVDQAREIKCIKIDADDYPDLKKKYGVLSLPTGILFSAKGEELKRFEGYKSVRSMSAFFQVEG